MAPIIDDKSPICIPFILEHLKAHIATQQQQQPQNATTSSTQEPPGRPFLIGLNGVQGVGKTTLVKALATALTTAGHETLVLSIDDLYLPHAEQQALAASNPDNALVQQRGEPGTHDMDLARRLFADLLSNRPTKIPSYDKAAFNGQGDRRPESEWEDVNQPDANAAFRHPVDVIILEGWCVGFRALPTSANVLRRRDELPSRTLARHKPEHLLLINDRLRAYDDALTDHLDAFVHVDAEDTMYVYDWRLEQEAALRGERGAGMSDEQVVTFVDGYYPAYELYSDNLRKGVFGEGGGDRPGRQLRMVVGKDRRVKETHVI